MKIICIGRNYADHAAEMRSSRPSEPVFFMKPETALIRAGQAFFHPDFSNEVHHEVELVFRIDRNGKHIQSAHAHRYYHSVGVGIDFTARDVQDACKRDGLPWEAAKAFDGSAPVSRFLPLAELSDPNDISFCLKKNGVIVQESSSRHMLFSVDRLIAHVSRYITLKLGDLLFTGTPSGVGKVLPGDELEACLDGQSLLKIVIR